VHEVLEGQEHAGGSHDPLTTRVSLTLSIMAVLLAMVTMLGHRASAGGSQKQAEAFDQWAFYQAKAIRQHDSKVALRFNGTMTAIDKEKAEKSVEVTNQEIEKLDKEKEEISHEAKKLQVERDVFEKKVDKYDVSESLLEIGLVLCSVTLLTRKSITYILGLAFAIAGLYFGLSGYLLH
jgi:hypothetical protein